MLEDELREILREVARELDATSVAIVTGGSPRRPKPELASVASDGEEPPQRLEVITADLGKGARLQAEVTSGHGRSDDHGELLERSVRAIRTCLRRWEAEELPEITVPEPTPGGHKRILDRMADYLRALASSQGMINAVVVRRGQPLVSAHDLEEWQRQRIPFAVRRVAAEQRRNVGVSSHAQVLDQDLYAMSFYFNACLVAFFDSPYPPDFVRHRARLVTRELSHLLSLLEEPDGDPANVAPIPE